MKAPDVRQRGADDAYIQHQDESRVHGIQPSNVNTAPLDGLVPRISKGRALEQGDEKDRDVDHDGKEQEHIVSRSKPSRTEGEDPLVQEQHRKLRQ